MSALSQLSLLILLTVTTQVIAQFPDPYERFQFDPQLNYDTNIPTPESILGYQLGNKFTLYADAVNYFEALAASSDKIILNNYGETYEGRKLYNVVITSAANHAKLETIRQNNLKFSSVDQDEDELESLAGSQPVFVSYSYNIHGNEASSTEAAMQVSYMLAAAQDAETANVLDNAVIIFYVCINPDGRDRYTYWYNGMQRAQSAVHPKDLEHYAPWPNGRTNHYWFDLNRDWIWGIHPESRGHTGEYQKWMPQVHVDYHEQGYSSNYFTVPGTTPTNLMLPDEYVAWADSFGRANIAEFDKHNVGYFTRERFDFFYPGYGSSYPSVMGAIGMLTEQGGIGGGTAIETSDGHVLTLRQRVFDHYTTSIATIKKAVDNREGLIRYQMAIMDPANSKSEIKSYVLPANNNQYLDDVLEMLLRQGVVIHQANGDMNLSGAYSYRTGVTEGLNIKRGDYIINTDQSRNLFINSVLKSTLEIEDSVMYDMSTWSAILAYNLNGYSSNTLVNGDLELVTKLAERSSGVIGSGEYAYTIQWSQRRAPAALAMLWKLGYKVRSAKSSFTDNDDELYAPGSLIVLRGRNLDKADRLEADLKIVAEEAGVLIKRQSTGRMMKGLDLTSPDAVPLKQPKVAMLVEPPFSTYTAGQIYFLFDYETGLPVERIRASILKQTSIPKFGVRYGGTDLYDYDVLILPGGGNGLAKLFGEEELKQIKNWVQQGGVLIAQEGAANFFTKSKSKMTDVELHEFPKDTTGAGDYIAYGDRTDYNGKKRIPGASLKGLIDVSHPLAFGMDTTLHTLKFGNNAIKPSSDLQSVGYFSPDVESLLTGGYASSENLEHLAGNTFAGVLSMGSGKVVFLMENTQYRMFWRGPSRMMQNAVM
ncbi:MAG: peptidase M14, partial [Bacteroidetes bacterium]